MVSFEVTDRTRTLLPHHVMLTLVKCYLITILLNNYIYPAYWSQITGEVHKGEFNPGLAVSHVDFEVGTSI
jgi:hypothetical protein